MFANGSDTAYIAEYFFISHQNIMARINKAAIIANANRSSKGCCCKCPPPRICSGLRVEVIKAFAEGMIPDTQDKLVAFDFAKDGEIMDGGVLTSNINFDDDQAEWVAAIPELEGSEEKLALRFTGYIRFDESGEKLLHVYVDDHLVMSLNGQKLEFTPTMIPTGQAINKHVATVAKVAEGLVHVNITYAQFTGPKGLRLLEVVDETATIIDSARFFHLA